MSGNGVEYGWCVVFQGEVLARVVMPKNSCGHTQRSERHRRTSLGSDPAATSVAAARSRIVACCRILPHTQAQQLMAGSPEVVSEECCLAEVCSHVVGVEIEVVYTTGTRHMRVLVVGEMAVSRIVPDAPCRIHKHFALVNDYGWA